MATAHSPSNLEPRRSELTVAESHERTEADDDRALARHLVLVTLVAIPLFVAVWVGIMALAVSFTSSGYAAPLAMGAGVGVLAGIFWAGWYAFVSYSSREERDRRARRSSEQA